MRSVGGVRRHAGETYVDFLRRGAAAVRFIKRTTAYRPSWGIVCRMVLTWAGHLACEDPATNAPAAALGHRDAAWDQQNDLLRHERIRRPSQSWPACYEKAVTKLLGFKWATEAQDQKAYAKRITQMTV